MIASTLNVVNNARRFGMSMVAAAAGLVGFASMPSTASADHHESFGVAIGVRTDDCGPRVAEERIWVPAVTRVVCEKVWVPAVVHTECDRVERAPVVEDRCERVFVPDRWESREIATVDRYGRRICHTERTLVERGHYTEVHTQVVVRPGGVENVERQVIDRPGHWDNVERTEVVCAGHWEGRGVVVEGHGHDHFELGFGFHGHR